jgi:hypothetical protein
MFASNVIIHRFFTLARDLEHMAIADPVGHGLASKEGCGKTLRGSKPLMVASYGLHTGCASCARPDQDEVGHPITLMQYDRVSRYHKRRKVQAESTATSKSTT